MNVTRTMWCAAAAVFSVTLGGAAVAGESVQVKATETALKGDNVEGTLRWPTVVGGDAAATKRINAALAFTAWTGETVEAVKKAVAECDCGFVGSDFIVRRNGGGVLSLSLSLDTMAAYPSQTRHHVAFDLATGKRLTGADIVAKGHTAAIVKLLDAQLQAQVQVAKAVAKARDIGVPESELDGRFAAKDLDSFWLDDQGVQWVFERFELPHVIEVLAPRGELSLRYFDIAPFAPKGAAWLPAGSQ